MYRVLYAELLHRNNNYYSGYEAHLSIKTKRIHSTRDSRKHNTSAGLFFHHQLQLTAATNGRHFDYFSALEGKRTRVIPHQLPTIIIQGRPD